MKMLYLNTIPNVNQLTKKYLLELENEMEEKIYYTLKNDKIIYGSYIILLTCEFPRNINDEVILSILLQKTELNGTSTNIVLFTWNVEMKYSNYYIDILFDEIKSYINDENNLQEIIDSLLEMRQNYMENIEN